MPNSLIRAGSVVTAAVVGAGLSLSLVTTALAHAEIEVEPARAGATDALITVIPEAHSQNAGVVSVQVFPPEGISPGDVTLVSAPDGWEMTIDDDSYTIAGDELEVDADPRHEIRVRRLPDTSEIYFRMLTTYSDGEVERWIELPSDDNPNPSHGAPGADLAPGDPAADPTSPPPATPARSAPASSPDAATDLAAADDTGNTALLVAIAVIAAAVAAAGTGWLVNRRRATAATPSEH